MNLYYIRSITKFTSYSPKTHIGYVGKEFYASSFVLYVVYDTKSISSVHTNIIFSLLLNAEYKQRLFDCYFLLSKCNEKYRVSVCGVTAKITCVEHTFY